VDSVVAGSVLQNGLSIVAGPTPNDAQGGAVLKALGNTLRGAGADTLFGTTDNDTFYVDNAQDQVIEAAAGGTADRVIASVSHVLQGNVENLDAEGTRSVNLTGNALNNVIEGNDAANKIAGGSGKDILSGGQGKDAFVFNTKLNKKTNVDRIVDFNVKDDTIQLDNAFFKKLGKTGKLKSDFFTVGTKAKDANDHIVYNSKTGVLYYDADGSGKGAAIHFATLNNKLKTLKVADFLVI
jgi:Ca2+-binding RTX toxin-like protein